MVYPICLSATGCVTASLGINYRIVLSFAIVTTACSKSTKSIAWGASTFNETSLQTAQNHRFMGLAKVIRRLLEKWEQLEDWFQERINKAIRERKPAPEYFPVADDKETLLQLYGLLGPIAALKTKSQNEDANQCEVLLSMFRLRTTVLDETQPIKDKMREASKPPLYYQVRDLTRLTKNTRALLANNFTRTSLFATQNEPGFLVIDLEQPHLRLDERTVEANVSAVKDAVVDRLRNLLLDISRSNFQAPPPASTIPQSSISPIESLADMLHHQGCLLHYFLMTLWSLQKKSLAKLVSGMFMSLELMKRLTGG
ncbi:unnamed protein product [Phytophthora fragariaefolia]|uniref:Unnamed protein product n=1 Tax=Phytophthora fragariaefolia TaxID=1490495 RepID=A0A9W6XNM5_9STRA|nr:unnamed protein product [Phytophthora fragariaefolia]